MRDYGELVGRLRESYQIFNCPAYSKDYVEPIKEAADAIVELQKCVEAEYQSGFADGQRAANRKKNKWISVEDALPEPGHRILFTDGVFVGEGYMTQSQHFERYYAGRVEDVLGITVTHWMPLPEPPEEGKA